MTMPELTVDMDGVLCRPAIWFNLAISRDVRHAPDVTVPARRSEPPLPLRLLDSRPGQVIRYAWRKPMPRVREGLAQLAELRRLVLVSGRPETARRATERWLIEHGLRDYFSEVILNDLGLSNAAFKLTTLRERGVQEHVDDDGRVAYFLAQEMPRTVFLIAWRRNLGLPYPKSVHRVQNLIEVAERLGQPARLASDDGGEAVQELYSKGHQD